MTGSDPNKAKRDKTERLSAALRENLRRRKAQTKGRRAEEEGRQGRQEPHHTPRPERHGEPRSQDFAGFDEDN